MRVTFVTISNPVKSRVCGWSNFDVTISGYFSMGCTGAIRAQKKPHPHDKMWLLKS